MKGACTRGRRCFPRKERRRKPCYARPMIEVALSELKRAVESQHGGRASYVRSVSVHEEHNGQAVWDGTVAVFDLADHPKATRVYAWSSPVEGSDNRRFYAVLHMGGTKWAGPSRQRTPCGRISWRRGE